MNKKITIKAQNSSICYCIVDFEGNVEDQLLQVHSLGDNFRGITVRMTDTSIQLVDYFHNDIIGSHDILSIEETTEEVSLHWHRIDAQ